MTTSEIAGKNDIRLAVGCIVVLQTSVCCIHSDTKDKLLFISGVSDSKLSLRLFVRCESLLMPDNPRSSSVYLHSAKRLGDLIISNTNNRTLRRVRPLLVCHMNPTTDRSLPIDQLIRLIRSVSSTEVILYKSVESKKIADLSESLIDGKLRINALFLLSMVDK